MEPAFLCVVATELWTAQLARWPEGQWVRGAQCEVCSALAVALGPFSLLICYP
jgi:hypothetical protein